jgi:hypothetical protein
MILRWRCFSALSDLSWVVLSEPYYRCESGCVSRNYFILFAAQGHLSGAISFGNPRLTFSNSEIKREILKISLRKKLLVVVQFENNSNNMSLRALAKQSKISKMATISRL